MFQFFEKSMNTDKVIRNGSAINNRTTITILTQEGIRHLRNCHPDLNEDVKNMVMSKYMLKLKKSGYNEVERKRVLASAMNGYKKQVEDDKSGKKPLYRSREWNREQREKEKTNKENNWFSNKGKFDVC